MFAWRSLLSNQMSSSQKLQSQPYPAISPVVFLMGLVAALSGGHQLGTEETEGL